MTTAIDTGSINKLSEAFRVAARAGYDVAKNGADTFDPDDVDQYYNFEDGDPEVYASVNERGLLVVQGVDESGAVKGGEALVVFSRSEGQ